MHIYISQSFQALFGIQRVAGIQSGIQSGIQFGIQSGPTAQIWNVYWMRWCSSCSSALWTTLPNCESWQWLSENMAHKTYGIPTGISNFNLYGDSHNSDLTLCFMASSQTTVGSNFNSELRRDSGKYLLWALCLWVSRRWEAILGYISKLM